MVPMLLEEYAKSGTDRARRQMLAMCEQHDPEIFVEVLSHFVTVANERLKGVRLATNLFYACDPCPLHTLILY